MPAEEGGGMLMRLIDVNDMPMPVILPITPTCYSCPQTVGAV